MRPVWGHDMDVVLDRRDMVRRCRGEGGYM